MSKSARLDITIKTGDSRPIFRQVVDIINLSIASGDLETGDKLPSVRALAERLSVNPNTIAKAYSELTTQGLLNARQGMGLFVSDGRQLLSGAERRKRLNSAIERCVSDVSTLGYSNEEVIEEFSGTLNRLCKVSRAG